MNPERFLRSRLVARGLCPETLSLGLVCALLLVAAPPEAQGQESQASGSSGLPVALTLSYSFNWSPESDATTGVGAGTASLHLSRRVDVGLAIRFWASGFVREECTLTDDRCLFLERTEGLAALGQVTVRPTGNRLFFLRGGIGLSYVTEETAPGFLILQERSWPFTVLFGIGSDWRLLQSLFITPSVEAIRTFHGDDTLDSAEDWQLQFGIGLTVG